MNIHITCRKIMTSAILILILNQSHMTQLFLYFSVVKIMILFGKQHFYVYTLIATCFILFLSICPTHANPNSHNNNIFIIIEFRAPKILLHLYTHPYHTDIQKYIPWRFENWFHIPHRNVIPKIRQKV